MSRDNPDLSYALGLSPNDAAAYLDSLGVRPTTSWHDLLENARASAFTVAQMTKLDLLNDVFGTLKAALKDGMTAREFRKILEPELAKRGWTGKREVIDKKTGEVKKVGASVPARLKLIFFQNMQQSYMAGRYRAQLANAENRPWWMYVAVLDARTRPGHAALNGRVFRYDDPFWSKFYPPNGFYCRCTVRALDDDDLERLGKKPESSEGHLVSQEVVVNPKAPKNEQKTVEQWGYRPIENGAISWASPGFAWSPGYATWGVDHVLAQKMDYLKNERLYTEVVQAINDSEARHQAFALWIAQALRSHARGDAAVLGLVQPEVIKKAVSEGFEPARVAAMTDYRVKHADSEGHKADGAALSEDQYKSLAANFAKPEAIYWLPDSNCALYILPDPNPDYCVFMFLSLPAREKNAMKKIGRYDGVITAYRKERMALMDTRKERLK